jgi:outer membrane protein insertion porin family
MAARLLFIACAFAASTALADDLGYFLGRRVAQVQLVIEGIKDGDLGPIRDYIDVAPGQLYSPILIHDSLVRLYKSGLISGARVEAELVAQGGVLLRFIVKPQARVENVLFEGRTIFPREDLMSQLNQLEVGQKLSPAAIVRGVGQLHAFYAARGYYQASIESQVKLDSTGTRATIIYRIDPGQQARVSKYAIAFKGDRLDLSKVKHVIVEGKPFARSDLQEEVERIKRAYLERDYLAAQVSAFVEHDPESNGVQVKLEIESGPKINVEIRGFKLSHRKKREILPFYLTGGIDDFSLEEGRRRLLDYIQRQGYFFAEVKKPGGADSGRLVYEVEPGQRYKLARIDIQGLSALPADQVKAKLKSKEASPIPFLGLDRGLTSNELLEQDSGLIEHLLRDLGYRRARVDVLRGVSIDGRDLIITFDVKQGPLTRVEEVALRGNNVLARDELASRLYMRPMSPLATDLVGKDAERILSAYSELGYAAAEVIPETFDLMDGRVRLVYSISEGRRMKIARVITRGANRTREDRLKSDFYLFKEGDWLNRERFEETERALYDTNAFASVVIRSEPAPQLQNGVELRNVTVDIIEAKPYELVYGFGYQSRRGPDLPGLKFLNGARGFVQLTNSNILGRLYAGSVQFRVSQDELLGQISFQNPRPFGANLPTIISLFARRLAEQSFRSDRYTVLVQGERRLSESSIFYLSYNFEQVRLFDLRVSEEEIERSRRQIRLGRIVPSFARDTRDNAFDPTRGSFTSGSISFAARFLGGNEQFVKLLVEHSRYYALPRLSGSVYSISARIGLAGRDLPISERFFGGGAGDLRGFGFERAGPRDPKTGSPLGGNALMVINNELRFPIWKIFSGAIFSDTGNVFRRIGDLSFGRLSESLGFGIRLKTPIGPLRFDLGFLVLNRPVGEPRSRFHISFGQTF